MWVKKDEFEIMQKLGWLLLFLFTYGPFGPIVKYTYNPHW